MKQFFVIFSLFFGSSVSLGAESQVEKLRYEGQPMRHGFGFGPVMETKVEVKDKNSIKRGEAVFKRYCIACHGSKAKGGGPISKEFELNAPNLRKLSQQFPDHHFFMQISKGPGDMPSWNDVLTPDQIVDITNYLQSL